MRNQSLCRTQPGAERATWHHYRLPCRVLQFGIKFFLATAGFMVLILCLSSDLPGLRNWRLLYAYFTIVVVYSEKVGGSESPTCMTSHCLQR